MTFPSTYRWCPATTKLCSQLRVAFQQLGHGERRFRSTFGNQFVQGTAQQPHNGFSGHTFSVVRGAGGGRGDLSPWLAAATKLLGAVADFPLLPNGEFIHPERLQSKTETPPKLVLHHVSNCPSYPFNPIKWLINKYKP